MFKEFKKAPLSTAENVSVLVKDFMDQIIKFAREDGMLYEQIPEIELPSLPDMDDEKEPVSDDDIESEMFDFFKNIDLGKKDPLSDVQIFSKRNNGIYK